MRPLTYWQCSVLSHCHLMCLFSTIAMVSFQHSCPCHPANPCDAMCILCSKHSIGMPSYSESKAKFLSQRLALFPLLTSFPTTSFHSLSANHTAHLIVPRIHQTCTYCLVSGSISQEHSFIRYLPGFIHICIKYRLTQSIWREGCMRCLKIFISSEPSSFLQRIPPKERTRYKRKDL